MDTKEFVKKWLREHQSPNPSPVSAEDQAHFETILADICEAFYESHPFIKDIKENRLMVVDTEWLAQHEKNVRKELIEKACEWLKRELLEEVPDDLCYKQWCEEKMEDFKKTMDESD